MKDIVRQVERAKTMLASTDHAETKIITIAYECGFREINAFNRNFKEETGMTPTEYRAFQLHFKRIVGVSPEKYKRDEN